MSDRCLPLINILTTTLHFLMSSAVDQCTDHCVNILAFGTTYISLFQGRMVSCMQIVCGLLNHPHS